MSALPQSRPRVARVVTVQRAPAGVWNVFRSRGRTWELRSFLLPTTCGTCKRALVGATDAPVIAWACGNMVACDATCAELRS